MELLQVNYLAVAVSSVIFFLLGSFWFSFLFRSLWSSELQRHNINIAQPAGNELMKKMLITFLSNFLIVFAEAVILSMAHATTVEAGLTLGVLIACIAAAAIAMVFVWEGKSLTLFLIDAGYPALGIIITSLLLAIWR